MRGAVLGVILLQSIRMRELAYNVSRARRTHRIVLTIVNTVTTRR
jgi:hypothetical protein